MGQGSTSLGYGVSPSVLPDTGAGNLALLAPLLIFTSDEERY